MRHLKPNSTGAPDRFLFFPFLSLFFGRGVGLAIPNQNDVVMYKSKQAKKGTPAYKKEGYWIKSNLPQIHERCRTKLQQKVNRSHQRLQCQCLMSEDTQITLQPQSPQKSSNNNIPSILQILRNAATSPKLPKGEE